MTIVNVTSAATPPPTTVSGASRVGGSGYEDRMQGAIDGAAQLFGMTPDALASTLSSGQSLSSLAAGKGVSQSDLVQAISTGIQQAQPQASGGPTGATLSLVAGRIANHVHRGHHGHGGGGGAAAGSLSAPTSTSNDASTSSTPPVSSTSPGNGSGFSALA